MIKTKKNNIIADPYILIKEQHHKIRKLKKIIKEQKEKIDELEQDEEQIPKHFIDLIENHDKYYIADKFHRRVIGT